ncbi:MAG: hypothetical protein U1E78_05955 [Gammaproteobacteria bacterium]
MLKSRDPSEYKSRLNIALQWIRHELAKLYTQKEPEIVPGFNFGRTIKAFWAQKINGHFHEFVVLNINWLSDEIKASENSDLYSFHVRKLLILKALLTEDELPGFIKLSESEDDYFKIIKQSLTHPETEIDAPLYTPSSKIIIDKKYNITTCIRFLNRIAVLEAFCDSFKSLCEVDQPRGQVFTLDYIPVEEWLETQVYRVELFLKRLIQDVRLIQEEQAYQQRQSDSLRYELQKIQETIDFARNEYHQHIARGSFYFFDRENHTLISNELSSLSKQLRSTEAAIHVLNFNINSIKIVPKFPEPYYEEPLQSDLEPYEERLQSDLKPFACFYLLEWLTFTPSEGYFNHRFNNYGDYHRASWGDTLSMTHTKIVNTTLSQIAAKLRGFWRMQINFINGQSHLQDINSLLRKAISILITACTIPFILMLPVLGLATLPFKKQKESFRMVRRNSLIPYLGMIACDLFASAIELSAAIGAVSLIYILTQGINFPIILAIPMSLLSPIGFPISLLVYAIDFGPLNACFTFFAGCLSLYFTTLLTTKILYSTFDFSINSLAKPSFNFIKDNIYHPIKTFVFAGLRKCADSLVMVESTLIDRLVGHLSDKKSEQPDSHHSENTSNPANLINMYSIEQDRPSINNDGDPIGEVNMNNTLKNPCNSRISRL